MTKATKQKIASLFPQAVVNKDIASETTFGVGGLVAYYLKVTKVDEFKQSLASAIGGKIPVCVMAGGSNLVFGDKTLDKLVIHYKASPKARSGLSIIGQNVVVEAGVGLAKLIKVTIDHGLSGLETLSGIPGTVGGAVVGNAGAYGHSISERITKIEIFDGQQVRTIKKSEAQFAYRDSIFKHQPWYVLRIYLNFKVGDRVELERISKSIIKTRNKKYLPGTRCPGSFFKNILVDDVPGPALAKIDQSKVIEGKIPTGYLLEAVGAKGMKRGDIAIAPFHGNLLMNTGRGTYRDTKALADILRRRVQKKFGITLEEEIRYMV